MSSSIKQPAKIKFGTAGIRGIFGQDVSTRESVAVCFAVKELLGHGTFGLGYDNRNGSRLLANAACAAMNWYGSDVNLYGMIPTPVLAFNVRKSGLLAGFSVTASHNPAQYAGIKVLGSEGIEFSLEAEHKLEELMEKSAAYVKGSEQLNEFGVTSENEEAIESYRLSALAKVAPLGKKLRILVDCGNGTSSQVTPRILATLGHEVVTVNAHPSGSFPGRLPEPTVLTLQEVARLTSSMRMDLGIAHDGDADRVVMIDENGSVVPDYALSCLVLKIVVEKVRRGTVVISYNSSNALERIATEAGCKVERSRLGKASEELYRRKGIFASEPTKIVDARWGYWEDGIYASILVAQHLSSNRQSMSSALQAIPKYFGFQWNADLLRPLVYELVKSEAVRHFGERIIKMEQEDGIKIWLKGNDAWVMIRSSGTEKKARVYGESLDKLDGSRVQEIGTDIVTKAQAI